MAAPNNKPIPEHITALVRELLIGGQSQTYIASKTGVSKTQVHRISQRMDAEGVERTGNVSLFAAMRNVGPAIEARIRYTRERQLAVIDLMLARVEERIAITNDARELRSLAVSMGIAIDKIIALERLDAGLAAMDEQENTADAGDTRAAFTSRITSITERLRTLGDTQRAN